MSANDRELTGDERARADAEALRLVHVAMVHFFMRPPARELPCRETPNADVDFSHRGQRYDYLTRMISNWYGQPERCALSQCRRAKLCRGEMPDCWRDEPPPTHVELDLAKGMMKYHLDQLLREKSAGEESGEARAAASSSPLPLAGEGARAKRGRERALARK